MTGKDFQISYSKPIESQDIMSSEDVNLSIKIALLIGVSDYQNASKLPACKDDMRLMLDLIKNTNKYDDSLFLNDDTSGDSCKEKIASFIRKYQSRKIEEVLFYYTGHGMRDNNDFLFLFSDFNDSKIESTSLRNSELDLMLKSLNPELAVKVVDACQSGTEYIKSNGDLEIILKNSSTENFNKTYFFFSSLKDQPSIAFQDYSIFTKSFVKALTTHNGSNIRYRDIMAHISDDLNVSKHQTPFFIVQANNTEIFCDLDDDLIKSITALLNINKIIGNAKNSDQFEGEHDVQTYEDKLISQVKEKGKDYCNEQEALASLQNMIDIINQFNWSYLINELYEVNIDAKPNYSSINDMKSIAKWLSKSKESYFAEITYADEEYETTEKIEIEENNSFIISSLFAKKRIEHKPVKKYRKVIDSIRLEAPIACRALVISFSPKEEILPGFKAFVVYILSKSKLTLFYKHEIEKEISWSKRITLNNNQWKVVYCRLKQIDEITSEVNKILGGIQESVIKDFSLTIND